MKETIMKEQELLQAEISTLASYKVEVIEPSEPRPTSENSGPEVRLRSIRTMSLAECAIPE
jgi:hypothetical protein